MQQSSSLSSKSYISNSELYQQSKSNPSVNWVSVINFLENQYTKSTIREKQWLLQKKLLDDQIAKLKGQLLAVENLNSNLNSKVKLLENTLKRQKLLKSKQQTTSENKQIEKNRTIQEVEKYFEKNGWNLGDKPQFIQEENSHRIFLNKILDEVGINFSKISEKSRKFSLNSVETQKLNRKDKTQDFKTMIHNLDRVNIKNTFKINAHLDTVRGIFVKQSATLQNNFIATVSQDCLLKTWNFNSKEKNQNLEPISCLRQHTGQLFALDGGSNIQTLDDIVLFTGGSQEFVKVWYSSNWDGNNTVSCVGSFMNDTKNENLEEPTQQNENIWQIKYKERKLLTSSSEGFVRLFNVRIQATDNIFTPQIKFRQEFKEKSYIQTAVQWVGQKGFLSSYSNAPRISLWDIETGKLMQKYSYEIDKPRDEKKKDQTFNSLFQINALRYVSDTKMIYSGCQDSKIRIFSYSQNKILKKLDLGIKDSINCIDFYKNNFIIAGCQDGSMKVWDRRTYKLLIDELSHLKKYDQGILCLKATQQGIFTGGADGVVKFYNF